MPKSTAFSGVSKRTQARTSLAAYPLLLIIYIYRFTLAPIFGGGCRFSPSCSYYAEEALRKHGAWRGSIMGARRVLRCHPWGKFGYDPVE